MIFTLRFVEKIFDTPVVSYARFDFLDSAREFYRVYCEEFADSVELFDESFNFYPL